MLADDVGSDARVPLEAPGLARLSRSRRLALDRRADYKQCRRRIESADASPFAVDRVVNARRLTTERDVAVSSAFVLFAETCHQAFRRQYVAHRDEPARACGRAPQGLADPALLFGRERSLPQGLAGDLRGLQDAAARIFEDSRESIRRRSRIGN